MIGPDGYRLAVVTPSLLCNYDCSYCRIKAKVRADYERELEEWLKALVGIGAPIIHMAGGEPTVLKGFEDFILDYPSPVRMTTNLWKRPEKWKPGFWRKFEYITLSFHPEYTTIDTFAEKVSELTSIVGDEGPRLACTIVACSSYLDDIQDWIERLTRLGVKARGQYQNAPANEKTKTYTESDLVKLKGLKIPMSSSTPGQEIASAKTLKSCNAGIFYTHINMRGDARRCSRDQMKLGNVFDGSFSWFGQNRNCVTACTEACDHTFATYRILRNLKDDNPNLSESDDKETCQQKATGSRQSLSKASAGPIRGGSPNRG